VDSPLYFYTHVIVRCHQGSWIHQFLNDFEYFVAKRQAMSNVANHPITPNHNHVFCLASIDLQRKFVSLSFKMLDPQHPERLPGLNMMFELKLKLMLNIAPLVCSFARCTTRSVDNTSPLSYCLLGLM
jgi:hypothetical protein